MALELTQPLIFPGGGGGEGGRGVGLTTLPPSCADCLEIWETQHSGTPQSLSRPVMGLLYLGCLHYLLQAVFGHSYDCRPTWNAGPT
jgi:hypothetical protein